ncbi:TonB-dependent receptor, partial [Oxalobacteraceae bacterium OM1]
MKETVISRSVRLIFAGGMVVGLGMTAGQGMAQDAGMQRIQVTGSNIKRTESEGIASTQILTRKDIEASGKTTIADVLRSISADNNGSISSSFSEGFAGTAAGVSLRGLGVNSTLILINGRRTAPYGFNDDAQRGFVDLNSIPFDAVDRIEVLKDGASAIYGSDAIGGVVNIILRKNFKGQQVFGSVGTSQRGDGTTARVAGTAGFGDFNDDGYNVFLNIDAQHTDRISQRNRDDYLGHADARPWGGRDQRAGAV